MPLTTILIILLVLILIGILPAWPHAQNFGWGPSGIIGVILLIIVILMLTGRL